MNIVRHILARSWRPQSRARGILAPLSPSRENVKARFASATVFSFPQNEQKSLPPDAIHRLKIYVNAFAAGLCHGHRWGALSQTA